MNKFCHKTDPLLSEHVGSITGGCVYLIHYGFQCAIDPGFNLYRCTSKIIQIFPNHFVFSLELKPQFLSICSKFFIKSFVLVNWILKSCIKRFIINIFILRIHFVDVSFQVLFVDVLVVQTDWN